MSGIPDDAMKAAYASAGGAANPTDAVAASLEFTVSQLQPAFGQIEQLVGEAANVDDLDLGSFALGMMAGTWATQGMDIMDLIRTLPVLFAEFLTKARAMQGREVCAARPALYPSVTCGLEPGHETKHAAGRLRW